MFILSFSSCGFYLLINFYFLFILRENPRPVQTIYTYTVWHCCLPVSKDADQEHHASTRDEEEGRGAKATVEYGDSNRAVGKIGIIHKETDAEEINGCQVLQVDPNPPGSLLMSLAEVKRLASEEKRSWGIRFTTEGKSFNSLRLI